MEPRELQGVAKSLADMATSLRISDGLAQLAISEKGVLRIDLLEVSPSSLGKELSGWLMEQASKFSGLEIVRAEVELDYDCTGVPSNREKAALFDLSAKCIIATEEKEYRAKSSNRFWWQRDA